MRRREDLRVRSRGTARLGLAEQLLAAMLLASMAAADPMPAPPILPTPAPHIRFGGGDGADCARPVVITGAEHETEGVRAERWWVYSRNPGSRIASQSVSEHDGKALETIRILTPDGRPRTICFDITSFYGRP